MRREEDQGFLQVSIKMAQYYGHSIVSFLSVSRRSIDTSIFLRREEGGNIEGRKWIVGWLVITESCYGNILQGLYKTGCSTAIPPALAHGGGH